MMTKEARAALREAAGKATPGPWTMCDADPHFSYSAQVFGVPGSEPHLQTGEGDELSVAVLDGPAERGTANARYIAAAHPAAVLSLLDRLARVEAALATARADALREAAAECDAAVQRHAEHQDTCAACARLQAESLGKRILSLIPAQETQHDR